MEKNLFLTGAEMCGKSSIIINTLGDRLAEAGGIMTARLHDERGAVIGFELMPACAAAGISGLEHECFLDFSSVPPRHDTEVFRGLGTRLLNEALFYEFAVADEVGGFDLIVPQFRSQFTELLNSDLPVIGVLKSSAEAEKLRDLLGLGERYTALHARLFEALEADPDTCIIEVSEHDSAAAVNAAEQWVKEYL